MAANLPILHAKASSILSPVSGFLLQAGFTHSLSPARNCTYGCSYCYVPSLRMYAGLQPDDWRKWGQFTTFKMGAAMHLKRQLRSDQIIYCSPLMDPYQPPEAEECAMPDLLRELMTRPPQVFVIQTRGPLILRDLELLKQLGRHTQLRVSFSLTTDREDIRQIYEPRCAPFAQRLEVLRELRAAGIRAFATLAPLLPCGPAVLMAAALEATAEDIIADPLHVRPAKPSGATTRDAAHRISLHHGHQDWLNPDFQRELLGELESIAKAAGRGFAAGPEGFSWLAKTTPLPRTGARLSSRA